MIIRVLSSPERYLMKISGPGIIIFALFAVGAMSPRMAQAESHDYEIASNDGYGLEDCLAAGSDCGHVVADAWCEAHGHGHALALGPRSVVEDRPTRVSASDEPYLIRCGD